MNTGQAMLFTPMIKNILCAALIATFVSYGCGIEFDSTFGSGGKFFTSFADLGDPNTTASGIFVQPSGRIVVVGEHSQLNQGNRYAGIALAGLTPAGLLDTSFGKLGKVLLWDVPIHRLLTNTLIQSDGSILVFHQIWDSSGAFRPAIVKLTPNGQPDGSFSADLNLFAGQTWPVKMAPGIGGKIYAVVRFGNQHYIVRLNSNGSRDTTFGSAGVQSLNLSRFVGQPHVVALAELPDGRLLIAGTYNMQTSDGQTFVTRLNADTTPDLSFGTQGVVRLGIPNGSVQVVTMKVQPDGKILIGGAWTFLGSTTLLVRLTARGRLDADFGTHGFAQTSFNDLNAIGGIAVAPDGTIFVTGISGDKALPSNQRLFVMRYSSTGTIASSIVTNFIANREAGASDILLQTDGKLLIGGFTQNNFDNFRQLAAARFNQ